MAGAGKILQASQCKCPGAAAGRSWCCDRAGGALAGRGRCGHEWAGVRAGPGLSWG